MIRSLAILFSVLFAFFLNAQGSLQFDHVHFEQLVSNSGSDPIVDIIVPSGQVFKLTSASLYRSSNYNLSFKKSAESVYSPIVSNNIDDLSFPIWLPPGSYHFKLINSCGSCTVSATFSGIFFNVTP
tara:strand:- start:681 stop:1061 length:381 start_codon:yes stop_codon:yes gene_type:complete